ncbi:MAG TPA: hypothetical protein VIN93_01445 [Bryobacteraceae bacterium]|jgi:hypothetical protein
MVELLFNSDIDLDLFERFILNSPIRIAEYATTSEGPSRTFVTDSRIPSDATQNDVWAWAKEELARIQAAISIECPGYHPATVRCLIDLLAEGGRVALINPPLTVRVHGTDSKPAINRILQSNNDFLNPYLHKSATDSDFKEAMMYCGQALGFEGANQWANLYRTYEVIADRFGGDDGVIGKLKNCSRNELERFKRTVNHQEAIGAFSRHARLKHQPPPNPMSFDGAVGFVLGLMASWFYSEE